MKNIVIIGGSSGIGLALVQNLSGENVVNISRTPCAVSGALNLTADVCDRAALARAFSRLHSIDVLVYCAGTSLAAPVEYIEPADYKTLFDVNLLGAVESCRLALPLLKKSEDPRIIMLGSTGGIIPIPFDSFYSASKAALIAFCAALRLEAPSVKSTAVIIGGTQTQFSFKRKIYSDCGEYSERLKRASDSLIKTEQTGYSADFVARKIVKIIKDGDPPYKVTVGAKNKLLTAVYAILPQKLRLALVKKAYRI